MSKKVKLTDRKKMCAKKTESPKKLSLLAHYDDLCRLSNSLMVFDENEYIELIRNMEKSRIQWQIINKELENVKKSYNVLLGNNNTQQITIKQLRFSLAKEVQTREQLRKERDELKQHLQNIRKFVLEDPIKNQNKDSRETMLTYLHRMETLMEVSHSSDTDDDIDEVNEIEFDKTEEEDEHSKRLKSHENLENIDKINETGIEINDNEVFDSNPIANSSVNIKQNRSQSEPIPISNTSQLSRNSIKSDSATIVNTGSVEKIDDCLPQIEYKTGFEHSILEDLDKRTHHFQKKKAFKPEKCDPCAKKIGFCGDCLKCRDCFATCHIECQKKVPLPCIPFNRQNNKDMASILIADYVSPNSYPSIPAQLLHLCNEIEKRKLDECVYRISASVESVEPLYKEMFIKSKKSVPSLESFDVKVLCSVLKRFLSSLNEPLVTNILWRDFIRSAEETNVGDRSRLIKHTISELPRANAHSLAFLAIHLKRVVKSVAMDKMDYKKMAAVFGPIIVGHSEVSFPHITNSVEIALQTKVMENLLQIHEDYWNSVVSAKHSSRTSVCNTQDVRYSLGTRLFSGTNVQKGSLSPRAATLSKNSRKLKPLF